MTSMAIAGSRPVARRRVPSAWITRRPQISGEQLPLDVDLSPSRLGSLILCAAGLFVLWSSWEFIGDILRAEDPVFVAIASIFPLIGVGLVLAGLVQLYRRQHVIFGESGVEVTERNLTGSRSWSMAYSEYGGVLQRQHTVRRKNRTTVYQIIQLLHTDPAYDLPLHVTRGDTLPRERWEAWAARLRLPALQLDDDRITGRPAEALDVPIDELLRAGHADAGIGFGPTPAAIRISEDGAGLLIELKRGRLPLAGYVLFALFALMFIAVGGTDPGQWPHMAIGLVLLGVIGWLAWKDRTSPRAIRISRDSVENLDTWRWNTSDAETLNLADVEGVRIYRSGRIASQVVIIESDRGTMHVGEGLGREDLGWLRDFLIAEIARRAPRGRWASDRYGSDD